MSIDVGQPKEGLHNGGFSSRGVTHNADLLLPTYGEVETLQDIGT